jgi:hypothetical protein
VVQLREIVMESGKLSMLKVSDLTTMLSRLPAVRRRVIDSVSQPSPD